MKKNIFIATGLIVTLLIILGVIFQDVIVRQFFKPTPSVIPEGIQEPQPEEDVVVVAQNLQIPWEVAVLPNGDYLITERPGTLKRAGSVTQSFEIEGVYHIGEGGLLGLTLHPNFEQNNYLYLYLTAQQNNQIINRVVRYRYDGQNLSDRRVILDNIPGARFHNGGRIKFGPDGYLYITTGDAQETRLSQDQNSLAGKILRIDDEGNIPTDNPFDNEVYSLGHRNPQGLAWDNEDRLWSTEHGPTGFDELNLITLGGNYGWPTIRGDQTQANMIPPIAHSGSHETWAPSGLAYGDNNLFFAGLRGQALYEARLQNGEVELMRHFIGEFGRLRNVLIHDGFLYLTTSNQDGRGAPTPSDDRLIRINLEVFQRQ